MTPYYPQPNTYPQATYFSQSTSNLRIVDDFNTINANDVPMSGISAFAKSDLSEVVVKRWTPQGTIQTLRYGAILDDLAPQTTNVSPNDLESKYGGINDAITGLNDAIGQINLKLDKLMKKGSANESKSNS